VGLLGELLRPGRVLAGAVPEPVLRQLRHPVPVLQLELQLGELGELPEPGILLAGPDPALRRLHQEDLLLELPVGLVLRILLQRLLARGLLLRLRLC